jgi:hypothetical protein
MTVFIAITTITIIVVTLTAVVNSIISITVIAAGNYSSSIYEHICDSLFLSLRSSCSPTIYR